MSTNWGSGHVEGDEFPVGGAGPTGATGATGDPGPVGPTGATSGIIGATGPMSFGMRWAYDDVTTQGDPGSGVLRFDDEPRLATKIYISTTSFDAADAEAFIDAWDDSDTVTPAYLMIVAESDPSRARFYRVVGFDSSVNNTTWFEVDVSALGASLAAFVDGETLLVSFTSNGEKGLIGDTGRTGPTGATGTSPGIPYLFDALASDGDPGAGYLRFDDSVYVNVTEVYLDNYGVGGISVAPFIDSMDDGGSSTHRGTLEIRHVTDPTKFAGFTITGDVTATGGGSGYRTLQAIHAFSGTSAFEADDEILVAFYRSGVGATGPAGAQGTQGTQGPQGAQGLRGLQGEQGIQGPAGAAGANGLDGSDGATGATGCMPSSYRYTFEQSTSFNWGNWPLPNGQTRMNNSVANDVTKFAFSAIDADGNDLRAVLLHLFLMDAAGTHKVGNIHAELRACGDPNRFLSLHLNSKQIKPEAGIAGLFDPSLWQHDVQFAGADGGWDSPVNVPFIDGEDVYLSFQYGTVGYTGSTGATGPTGATQPTETCYDFSGATLGSEGPKAWINENVAHATALAYTPAQAILNGARVDPSDGSLDADDDDFLTLSVPPDDGWLGVWVEIPIEGNLLSTSELNIEAVVKLVTANLSISGDEPAQLSIDVWNRRTEEWEEVRSGYAWTLDSFGPVLRDGELVGGLPTKEVITGRVAACQGSVVHDYLTADSYGCGAAGVAYFRVYLSSPSTGAPVANGMQLQVDFLGMCRNLTAAGCKGSTGATGATGSFLVTPGADAQIRLDGFSYGYPFITLWPGQGDDAQRVQDAIDSLPTMTHPVNGVAVQSGGVICLRPGFWDFGAQTVLVNKPGVTILGHGVNQGNAQASTRIYADGTTPAFRVSAYGSRFADVTFLTDVPVEVDRGGANIDVTTLFSRCYFGSAMDSPMGATPSSCAVDVVSLACAVEFDACIFGDCGTDGLVILRDRIQRIVFRDCEILSAGGYAKGALVHALNQGIAYRVQCSRVAASVNGDAAGALFMSEAGGRLDEVVIDESRFSSKCPIYRSVDGAGILRVRSSRCNPSGGITISPPGVRTVIELVDSSFTSVSQHAWADDLTTHAESSFTWNLHGDSAIVDGCVFDDFESNGLSGAAFFDVSGFTSVRFTNNIFGRNFGPTKGYGIRIRDCRNVALIGNVGDNFFGNHDPHWISIEGCTSVTVASNAFWNHSSMISAWVQSGTNYLLRLLNCDNVTVSANTLLLGGGLWKSLRIDNCTRYLVVGNMLGQSPTISGGAGVASANSP